MSTLTLLTADEFLALPSNGHSYELIRGELLEMMPGGGFHGTTHLEIAGILRDFVRPRSLGRLFGAETGFRIEHDPDTVRAPDVAFLTQEHWEAQPNPAGFLEGAPDLAVEVVSPSDRFDDVHEKALQWLEAGCSLVWVVERKRRTVTVYRPDGTATVLREQDEITAEPLLPGFSARVAQFFE